MHEYIVIVCAATGARYECANYREAQEVFDSAPVAQDGERLLTINGAVVRREYLKG